MPSFCSGSGTFETQIKRKSPSLHQLQNILSRILECRFHNAFKSIAAVGQTRQSNEINVHKNVQKNICRAQFLRSRLLVASILVCFPISCVESEYIFQTYYLWDVFRSIWIGQLWAMKKNQWQHIFCCADVRRWYFRWLSDVLMHTKNQFLSKRKTQPCMPGDKMLLYKTLPRKGPGIPFFFLQMDFRWNFIVNFKSYFFQLKSEFTIPISNRKWLIFHTNLIMYF